MWNRRHAIGAGLATAATLALTSKVSAQTTSGPIENIEIDLKRVEGSLDHVWSECAGSDRAAITLREQWRQDLRRFKSETGLKRVRFHGIFADELGVYAPSILSQKKIPNWQNIDRVYDGLIENGVRPMVELSFMPKHLASGKAVFGFYAGNITPPAVMADWGSFISAFVQHLVDRYGLDEVRHWPFEVWNEPNLPFFWTGTQADYFELYKTTVQAIKSVDQKLIVGGPSSSAIQWIPEFLTYCKDNNLPVDFISTHIYAGDKQDKIFGKADTYSQNDVIPAGMKQVRAQIEASAYSGAPLYLSEWSSDSPAMIAHVIKGCLGVCQMMSHWTFTNTYEELGVSSFVLKEGDNGFGMMAVGGIPKPQFNTYKLLNLLGDKRLAASDGPVLASRRPNGASAIAVWNLAETTQPGGIPGLAVTRKVKGDIKTFKLALKGARAGQLVRVSYVDQVRGGPFEAWRKLGSPQYPTLAQMDAIRKSAELPAPEILKLSKARELTITLPPEGIALIELSKV